MWYSRSIKRSVKVGTKIERNVNSNSDRMYNATSVNSFAVNISFSEIHVHSLTQLAPFESFSVSTNWKPTTDFSFPSCLQFCYWIL